GHHQAAFVDGEAIIFNGRTDARMPAPECAPGSASLAMSRRVIRERNILMSVFTLPTHKISNYPHFTTAKTGHQKYPPDIPEPSGLLDHKRASARTLKGPTPLKR